MPGEIPKPKAEPEREPIHDPDAHAVLSADEVQRKLDQMTASGTFEASQLAPPPVAEVKKGEVNEGRDSDERTKHTFAASIDWESAPAIFDQMVTGIRRDREVAKRETAVNQSKIDADWQHVLESMRELQRKVAGHRNLIYFTISRDQQDISIKLVDHTDKRGYALFTLARRHPTGQHQKLNAIWLIEFPAREWHYYDAKEAMAEFVTRIAGLLA